MEKVPNNAHGGRIETIENVAEAKGVELDDIDVFEGTTDTDDDAITFRLYTKKADTEKDSVGTQFTVVEGGPVSSMDFRNRAQDAISALKRGGSNDEQETEEIEDERQVDTTTSNTSTQDFSASIEGDTPEAELLEHRQNLERRVQDLERRVEELEEYIDALEGLQKLMGNDND